MSNALPTRAFLVADLARIDAEEAALRTEREGDDDISNDRSERIDDMLLDLYYDRGLVLGLIKSVDEAAAEAQQDAYEARRAIY